MYGTIWALIPPVVAIVLALITKEVYSSLFVGIGKRGDINAVKHGSSTLDHIKMPHCNRIKTAGNDSGTNSFAHMSLSSVGFMRRYVI